MSELAENLARVRELLTAAARRAGRDPAGVGLIAVSKTKPASAVQEAVAAGQYDFGENYAQELRDKMARLPDPEIRWHFIGHLQKNKVKYVAGKVYRLHSLDSLALAQELAKRAEALEATVKVLVEVNLGGETTKSGVSPETVGELVKAVRRIPRLELAGLMTMPPYFPDPEDSRPFYRRLRELRERLREELEDAAALPELSMGMSHDFPVAVEEGATWVRVGTAIFGQREKEL